MANVVHTAPKLHLVWAIHLRFGDLDLRPCIMVEEVVSLLFSLSCTRLCINIQFL